MGELDRAGLEGGGRGSMVVRMAPLVVVRMAPLAAAPAGELDVLRRLRRFPEAPLLPSSREATAASLISGSGEATSTLRRGYGDGSLREDLAVGPLGCWGAVVCEAGTIRRERGGVLFCFEAMGGAKAPAEVAASGGGRLEGRRRPIGAGDCERVATAVGEISIGVAELGLRGWVPAAAASPMGSAEFSVCKVGGL